MSTPGSMAGGDVTTATDALESLAEIASEIGVPTLETDARLLASRVLEGRFFVACVGQFKRGKSSLVNALVGANALPTGVAPVTSVVTVVRYGESLEARVAFDDGPVTVPVAELGDYVSEDGNPSNVKQVRAVEVFVPNDMLRSGMCIVDTPGIGSVIGANTSATSAFVPKIDAALVVLGADPPISGEELALVGEIAAQIDTLLFVLSKADRVSDAERREARTFTERVLRERFGRMPGPVFEVSAVEQLGARRDGRDWKALVTTLAGLAAESRDHLVGRAATRGTVAIATALLREIDERIGALERPAAESEQRIAALRGAKLATERSLRDLHPLMAVAHERVASRLRQRQEAFLARILPTAASALDEYVTSSRLARETRRRMAFERAQELYRELVDRWRAEEQEAAERLYRESFERFVELAMAAMRDTVRATGERGPGFDGSFEIGFRVRSQLRYTELLHITGRSPIGWLVDQLRPPGAARRAVVREALHYLRRLLETNASRVTSDLEDQARESRRQLEKELVQHLQTMCDTAERALARAREQRARGEQAVSDEMARLSSLRRRVTSVMGEFT